MIARLPLFVRTLRYIPLRQIILRIRFEFLQRAHRRAPTMFGWLYARGAPNAETPIRSLAPFARLTRSETGEDSVALEVLERASAATENQFEFLNKKRCFGARIDWRCPDMPQLWRYHLHYWEFALDLGLAARSAGEAEEFQAFRRLATSWIRENPVGTADAWHPYTASLRVGNCTVAIQLLHDHLEQCPSFRTELLGSLWSQCRFLRRNLESHVRGNHLLENLRALIMGGCFFEGHEAAEWLAHAKTTLQTELNEQILSDGGHFERSPMYHLKVMRLLAECVMVLQSNKATETTVLRSHLSAMAGYASALLLPQGVLPLLGDTAFDQTPDPRFVIDVSHRLAKQEELGDADLIRWLSRPSMQPGTAVTDVCDTPSGKLGATGYFILGGRQGNCAVIDAGDVCPDYLPAHGHADSLSYELWLDGLPLVTDSGIFEYTTGEWRTFFRSTAAHNTVVVDGEDNSEVWGSFRVARRARPGRVSVPIGDGISCFRSSHDGYRALKGSPVHNRIVFFAWEYWLVVIDEITGHGIHEAASLLHFHPDAEVTSAGRTARISRNGNNYTLTGTECDEVECSHGDSGSRRSWYSPQFGVRHARACCSLTSRGRAPLRLSYVITREASSDVDLRYRDRYMDLRIEDRQWRVAVDWEAETCELLTGGESYWSVATSQSERREKA